jgi:hypothetical protein
MRLPKLPWLSGSSGRAGGRSAEGWADHEERETVEALRAAADSLAPDEAALERMLAVSRQAFRDARFERTAAESAAASATPKAAARRVSTRPLRVAAALSVALLTLTGAGVVAAAESGPGEPFYRTRLAVEGFFLPAYGTPERLTADLDRAQARLDEAARAAAAGDHNAEADAMGAYGDVIGSIAVPQDPAARQQMVERLNRQLGQLRQLQSQAGGQAGGKVSAELERAMRRIGQVLAGSGQPTPNASPTGQGPQATPSHEPGSTGDGPKASPGGGGGPNPGASPSGQGGGPGDGGQGGGQDTGGPQGPNA